MKSFGLNKDNAKWWVPILLMAIITPFTPMLDLWIERYFYQGDGQFISNNFTNFFYNWGFFPADIVAIIAAIVLVLSYVIRPWKKVRSLALMLVLTLVLGAGIITHAILKDHWGRPRPKQITEFGGMQAFRPYYYPNFFHQPEPSKSFPCGHCSTGFYFFALALAAKRMGNKILSYGSYIFAFILGIALGITRMAQGGHFLSDVLMTALIMWLTALTCEWLIYSREEEAA
jgi:lipid A 4'-phosphatase